VTNLSYLRASPLPALNNTQPEQVGAPQAAPYLQLGAFATRAGANQLIDQLASLVQLPLTIYSAQGLYRVVAGPLNTQAAKPELQRVLVDSGFDAGYVISLSAEQLSQ